LKRASFAKEYFDDQFRHFKRQTKLKSNTLKRSSSSQSVAVANGASSHRADSKKTKPSPVSFVVDESDESGDEAGIGAAAPQKYDVVMFPTSSFPDRSLKSELEAAATEADRALREDRTSVVDQLYRLFRYIFVVDPTLRSSVDQVLNHPFFAI